MAGLTGVAGLTAVAGLTGGAGLADVAGLTGLHLEAANQVVGDRFSYAAIRQVSNDVGGQGPVGTGEDGDGGTPVGCDPNDLIEKLTLANAGGGGVLKLAYKCTYTLTANDGLGNGLPVVVAPITVKGNEATIVRAATAAEPAGFRIFNVGVGGDLTLSHLTVKGGKNGREEGGGGILVQAGGSLHVADSTITHNITTDANLGSGGAGIANHGTTTVANSTISYNSATNRDGGAISSTGFLTVERSRLIHNNAANLGGAIRNLDVGVAVINNSTISNNDGAFGGGGIFDDANTITTVNHSTIKDNTASEPAGFGGGGIGSFGRQLTLRHSTVSHNTSAAYGGGITNGTLLVIEDSAVTANTAHASGGGIINFSGTIFLRHSQVNLNRAIDLFAVGGGIANISGSVTLTDTRVSGNNSTMAPGGVETTNSQFTLDSKSVVIDNRPTNCQGSTVPVPNCFG